MMIETITSHPHFLITNSMINTTSLSEDGFSIQKVSHPEISEDLTLIVPLDMGTSWNDNNARYRSVLLNSTGDVVSQGFGKFTNYGEKPDFQPWDPSWPIEARHKVDGSCLIISKYQGVVIARTRGTADARNLPNGNEIEILRKKYPTAFDNVYLDDGWSLLFEWTTPTNIIVIREHNEPTLTLLGLIDNESATLMTPRNVDVVAVFLGLSRPERYCYDSLSDCIADVSAWRGKEGVVICSPDGQTLKKIKADAYKNLHRLATGIKNIGHVMELFISSPRFTRYEDFYAYVESTLDYEVAEKIKDDIAIVVDAYNSYLQLISDIKHFISSELDLCATRKDAAHLINSKLPTWQAKLAFTLYSRREISQRQFSGIMFSILTHR